MARAGKGMGKADKQGHQTVGTTDPRFLRERDMENEVRGKNRLQGDDQLQVRNQKLRQPKVGGASGAPRPDWTKGDESADGKG